MKKMYKQPIVEATELRGGFVMNGTSGTYGGPSEEAGGGETIELP